MRQIVQLGIVFYLLLVIALPVSADFLNRDWEKQITDKLAEKVKATELLWLDASGDTFLALNISQISKKIHGAAIILHAMGGHADWPQTISPPPEFITRIRMDNPVDPAFGYCTGKPD